MLKTHLKKCNMFIKTPFKKCIYFLIKKYININENPKITIDGIILKKTQKGVPLRDFLDVIKE